jgi:iron complex outermembrane receptor protein
MIPTRLIAGVSTLLFGCAVATVSTAQQAPSAGPPSSAANPDALATIVVTAGKRAEDIQSVPYSISAVSGAELESRHIDNVEDIVPIAGSTPKGRSLPASRRNGGRPISW